MLGFTKQILKFKDHMHYTNETIEDILRLKAINYSGREIAELLGISKSGVNNTISRANGPKVLFFDLENAPSIAAAFQRYDVTLTPSHIVEEGGWLLSSSWKWLGSDKTEGVVVTPQEALERDDSRIVEKTAEQFQKADFVVAHNGRRFDVPLLKTRVLANGFDPIKTVRIVDTLVIAKSLKFNSNKLDSLGQYLNLGRKVETTGIGLWLKCMNGDPQSLKKMLEYNKQDVDLLEALYLELRPYDKTGPNYGQYYNDGKMHCPACGGTELVYSGNSVYTIASEFEELVCQDCGHRSRTRGSINSKDQRANLLMRAG